MVSEEQCPTCKGFNTDTWLNLRESKFDGYCHDCKKEYEVGLIPVKQGYTTFKRTKKGGAD